MREALARFGGPSVVLRAGLAIWLVAASACGETTEPPPGGGGGRTYVTTYSVAASGDGQMTSIQFDNGLGELRPGTIIGPTWTAQVIMAPGDQIRIVVAGTVTNGDIVVSMTSDDGVGSVVSDSDTCSGTGSQVDCDVTLDPLTLP